MMEVASPPHDFLGYLELLRRTHGRVNFVRSGLHYIGQVQVLREPAYMQAALKNASQFATLRKKQIAKIMANWTISTS